MAIDPVAKMNWERLQEKHDHPVDAAERPIDPKDTETLKVWQDEGIDRFLKE